MFLNFILSCLYFFLPAYFANLTPPLAKRLCFFESLARPVDAGKKFKGKPFFGAHKTWRGVILGITIGFLAALIQKLLYQFPAISKISFLNYQEINIYLFGFLISFGAIFGDIFFAFIKRRLNLKPGTRFLPFDQINYVIGAAIFIEPFFEMGFRVWFALIVLTFFLHVIMNYAGYLLGLHKAKW